MNKNNRFFVVAARDLDETSAGLLVGQLRNGSPFTTDADMWPEPVIPDMSKIMEHVHNAIRALRNNGDLWDDAATALIELETVAGHSKELS